MGQLTNQYVSQSYQGLLKLANSTTGVTSTLQYVEDGLGNKIPMQVSTSSVVITGSFRGDGSGLTGITVDSGSLVTTSSFNAYTSSNDSKVNSLIAATGSYASQTGVTALSSSIATTDLNQDNRLSSIETITGSLQNQINQKLDTGSFNTYTSSNDSKVNSLISATGSYATTSSLTSLSQSIASTDLAQNNRLTSIEGVTGSFASTSSLNSYTLTSSFNSYTSSANGRLSSLESATGSLQNQINQKLDTGSFNSYTSSNDAKVNSLINATGSYATTGSNNFVGQQNINGSVNVTGSVNITGTVTATSASFTYVNTVYETASVIYSSGSNQLGDASDDTQTLWGTVVLPSGPLVVTGSITATNFTGSLQGTASYATNALSSSHAIYADTASFATNVVSSSYATNAATASIARDVIVTAKCNNPGGLTKGTVVRIVGADGDNPLIDSASYINEAESANVFGMLSENIAFNAFGNVVVNGKVIALNTVDFPASSLLYLSSSGQYTTSSAVPPLQSVRLGQVLRQQLNNGSIYFKAENGYELGELHNVIDTATTTGELLSYVSGSYGLWENRTFNQLGLATTGSNTFVGAQTINNDVTINSSNPFGTFVNLISTGQTSFNLDSPLTQFQSNGQIVFTNTLSSTGSSDISFLTQNGGDIILNTSNSGSVNITGSVNVKGIENISGSLNMTPSSVLTLQTGSRMAVIGDDSGTPGAIGFFADASTTRSFNIQAQPGGNGTVAMSDFPSNNHFMFYNLPLHWIQFEAPLTSTGSGNAIDVLYGMNIGTNQTSSAMGLKVTGSFYERGTMFVQSNNTTVSPDLYLTSSLGGQSNIIQGWGDNQLPGGPGASQANYTGSLTITGSNNTVSMPQIRATAIGGNAGQQGYISGSNNMIMSNASGIFLNTGSLLFPKTQNNILGNGSSIIMNFTTSSLAGGHPIVANNLLMGGQINISSPSGSVQSINSNALLGGGIASTQNFVTNTRPSIGQNNVIGQITLNHISSSINYTNNYNNSPVTINNHLSSSNITNNNVSVSNNAFLGGSTNTGVSMWISGSQSSNATRNVIDNLIGGKNIIISSSFVSSSNSSLVASLIYGQNLTVSGSNSTTVGGSAFLGRYNGLSGLEYSQDIVFAVGTGTGTSNRRTGLWITSGSVTNVSGSMNVIGQTTMTASSGFPLYVSGTMQTQRIHFDGNPFNTNPASSLGAIRYDANNENFSITNYNKAEITSGSFNELYLSTGSNYAHSKQLANYANTSAVTTLSNSNGNRVYDVNVDNVNITGSVNINSVMKLQALDPLPAGALGQLAVSSSNELYFHNGSTWNLIS